MVGQRFSACKIDEILRCLKASDVCVPVLEILAFVEDNKAAVADFDDQVTGVRVYLVSH